MTNADRCFEHFVYGNWKYKSTDKLRYDQNDEIFKYKGTPIGMIYTKYDEEEDVYYAFVILSLQKYKSDPSYITQTRALYKSAVNYGYEVVFVNELDLGFGLMYDYSNNIKFVYERLARLQSITKAPQGIAIYAYDKLSYENTNDGNTYYFLSYETMERFMKIELSPFIVTSINQPDYPELISALRLGVLEWYYAKPAETYSDATLGLLDEINMGVIRNTNNHKLKIYHISNKLFNKQKKEINK